MRSQLPVIAQQVGVPERTLRRAAGRGTIRCKRPSPRRLVLDPSEREYLTTHWDLLSKVTSALRTEPNVKLAVLYGSTARGDDTPRSDVDLLVELHDDNGRAVSALGARLEAALGRDVDLARLPLVRERSPLLLLQAIDEGRVVVDRGEAWPPLRRQRGRLAAAAREQEERERGAAERSVAELLGEVA